MISPARQVSFEILCRVWMNGAFSDYALNSPAVARLDRADRNLVTEIVYGTLRWHSLLDYAVAGACSRPWEAVEPKARILLRMSAYQMWRMDRIPDHALVNDAVEIAKRELRVGVAGFVNGVLRHLALKRPWQAEAFEQQCPPWIAVSLPKWLWERWTARFGEPRARQFALSLNEPPQSACRIRANEVLPTVLLAEMVPSHLVPGAYLVKGGRNDAQTIGRLQDEASQLVPELLGETAGWRIWDACAAPGGKSAILLDKSGVLGLVVSSDARLRRAARLRHMLESCCGAAEVLVTDAEKPPPFRICFDAVLADVPCSGLGTLRRNPEIKWRFEPERLAGLQKSQIGILNSVAAAVRAGGFLLYSTCSTEPEENENVIETFLDSHPDFQLRGPVTPPGIEAWLDRRGLMRTFPSERLWDGFFAALMVRSS